MTKGQALRPQCHVKTGTVRALQIILAPRDSGVKAHALQDASRMALSSARGSHGPRNLHPSETLTRRGASWSACASAPLSPGRRMSCETGHPHIPKGTDTVASTVQLWANTHALLKGGKPVVIEAYARDFHVKENSQTKSRIRTSITSTW